MPCWIRAYGRPFGEKTARITSIIIIDDRRARLTKNSSPIFAYDVGMMRDEDAKLICFDLGGVLVRLTHTWDEARQLAGVREPERHEDPFTMEPVLQAVFAWEVGEITDQTFFRRTVEALPSYSLDEIEAIVDAWLLGLYPGVEALFDELESVGHPIACLSNTNHRHWSTLLESDNGYAPLQRLHHPFASHLIQARKPDASAYAAVETAMGLSPERIIFFDDRAENIATAHSRGWSAHQVDPHDDPIQQIRTQLTSHGLL